jgi:hypothetical protein
MSGNGQERGFDLTKPVSEWTAEDLATWERERPKIEAALAMLRDEIVRQLDDDPLAIEWLDDGVDEAVAAAFVATPRGTSAVEALIASYDDESCKVFSEEFVAFKARWQAPEAATARQLNDVLARGRRPKGTST